MAKGNATISLVMFLFKSLTVRLLSNNVLFSRHTGNSLAESNLVTKLAKVLSDNPNPKGTIDFFKGSDVTCPILSKTAECQLLVIAPIHKFVENVKGDTGADSHVEDCADYAGT
jgi:hypothetical protein